MEITRKTTLETWKDTLKYVIEKGEDFDDVNKRVCREVLNLKVTILNPLKDITMPIEILNGFEKWVYPHLAEIANITLAKNMGFNFNDSVNQIDDFIIPLLKKDPNSRRAVVTTWNPLQDSNVYNKLVPGLMMIDFKLRDGKLNLTSVVRSNDMFFGWSANIYQLFVLQKYVMEKLDCKIGSLSTFSTSAHIFGDQFSDIKKVLSKY